MSHRRHLRSALGACAAILAPLATGVVLAEEPVADAGRVFVEVTADPATPFLQQRTRLVLRVGVEAAFLEDQVVPITHRALNPQMRVEAPWLEELPGVPPESSSTGTGPLLGWGDGATRATEEPEVERDGQRFRVFTVVRDVYPEEAGVLDLSGAAVRYAWGARFEEDALGRRRAVDRRDGLVAAEPLRVTVRPLPLDLAPPGFGGAVGRFRIEATGPAGPVKPGESFPLVVRVTGEGNFHRMEAPRVETGDEFHVFGNVEERRVDGCTFTHDVAVVGRGVTTLPQVRLVHFDPESETWETATTERAALVVEPTPGEAAGLHDVAEDPSAAEGEGRERGRPALWLAVLAVVAGAMFAAWRISRRSATAKATGSPGRDERVRAAAAALRSAIASADGDAGAAFARFLGACLGATSAVAVSPDLEVRLTAAGVPHATAREAVALLLSLTEARYAGGRPSAEDLAGAGRIVDAIDP